VPKEREIAAQVKLPSASYTAAQQSSAPQVQLLAHPVYK